MYCKRCGRESTDHGADMHSGIHWSCMTSKEQFEYHDRCKRNGALF